MFSWVVGTRPGEAVIIIRVLNQHCTVGVIGGGFGDDENGGGFQLGGRDKAR